LALLIQVGRQVSSWEFLLLPLPTIAVWWITAGIGIRLGVYPSEFFRAFARFAGFIEPEKSPTTINDGFGNIQ
jgi:hypothetical protein